MAVLGVSEAADPVVCARRNGETADEKTTCSLQKMFDMIPGYDRSIHAPLPVVDCGGGVIRSMRGRRSYEKIKNLDCVSRNNPGIRFELIWLWQERWIS